MTTELTTVELHAEIERLRAELAEERSLAADITEYRVRLPHNGGVTLLVRRSYWINGGGWAVSTEGFRGGRAFTKEGGWQDAIAAMSMDQLFCWPDAATAIREGREAL